MCLDICALAKKTGDVATRNTYACVGTCVETSYGEDAASRGRILLFEVDYVPCRRKSRSGGKGRGVGHAPRFTLTHAKKVRGAVSQCAQVMEHIIVSVANRVEVYSVEGKEMKQIATHHAQELGVLHLKGLGVCGGFTPSTRVASRREDGGWSLFRF